MESVRKWFVADNTAIAEQVAMLRLVPEAGRMPEFVPGQFVNAYLPAISVEGKSYSVTSAPHEPYLELAVREMGRFSGALTKLQSGEALLLSEPHGFFTLGEGEAPRVFIAAGIGIAPIRSMFRAKRSMPPSVLLSSNRTRRSTPFSDEFALYARGNRRVALMQFLTRETRSGGAIRGRIDDGHLRDVKRLYPDADWYLCGGVPFVRDMRLMLKDIGVGENDIFTGSFF